jgi:hypothetical protein
MKKILIVTRHDLTTKQNRGLKNLYGKDTLFIRYPKTIERSEYTAFAKYCKSFDSIIAILSDELISYLVSQGVNVVRPHYHGHRGEQVFSGWVLVKEFNYQYEKLIPLGV